MNWIKKKISEIKASAKKIIKKMPAFSEIEASPWMSCECSGPILKSEMRKSLFVCPKCNKHHRIDCRERFNSFFGSNNYKILDIPIDKSFDDPLKWVDQKPYIEKLKAARKKTQQNCAVEFAVGKLENGIEVTVGAMSFSFLGASVGIHEGNTILAGVNSAIENKTPLIFFPCGGGQRLHESLFALSQMSRTTVAILHYRKTNLPYIVCFTDPTSGGITGSFASLGDINLAEPNCMIGFAGPRVIRATVPDQTLKEDFQKSESVLKHGFVDHIVERKDIKKTITNLLSILLKKNELKTFDEESSENKESPKKVASAS